MHKNTELLFARYARPVFQGGERVLEIGPDKSPSTLQQLAMVGDSTQWDTLGLYPDPTLTYVADNEYSYPVPDNHYDIVLSANVAEHVRKVWVWIKELTRICKVGGHVITIVPVSWPCHRSPYDCWRIYPDGMNALYEEAGLRMDVCRCQTLEVSPSSRRRVFPGMSAAYFERPHWWKTMVKNLTRFPVTSAFDTIAIGTKL